MCTAGVCVHDGSVRVQGKCVCTMGVYMCPVGVGVHDGGRGVHDGDVCVQGRCVCMMGVYVCARWGCVYAWGCGYAQQVTCLTLSRLLLRGRPFPHQVPRQLKLRLPPHRL